MTKHFCTISTGSHLGKTFALCHSITTINENVILNVLITDKSKKEITVPDKLLHVIKLYDAGDLDKDELFRITYKRYSKVPDKMRWTLKPVFLKWLLTEKMANSIIYVDNDIFFSGDYSFLFEMLQQHNILLTPHWRPDNPVEYPWWFETNFRDGVYNAGFIGANKDAVNALHWWANACLYRCTKSYIKGFFDDQKYLDLMPVIEAKTAILQHKGCNVAYWNADKLPRKISKGHIYIAEDPLIFVHFANCTIAGINTGKDHVLKELLLYYINILNQYNFNINIDNLTFKEKFWGRYRHVKWLLTGGIMVLLSLHYNTKKSKWHVGKSE